MNLKGNSIFALSLGTVVLIATAASALEIQDVEPNNDFDTAQIVDDSFSVGTHYGIENSDIWPWVSIRGTNGTDGTFDVYSFVVPAGVVHGIFDIDFSINLDSWIELYGRLPDGSVVWLASDNNNGGDPGSLAEESPSAGLDSRLYFTFDSPEPGEYFIRVGRASGPFPLNVPLPQGYILNITLSDNGDVDEEPPIIICPPNLTIQCGALVPAADFEGGVASDDRLEVAVDHVGDVTTPGDCANSFTVARTYRATDPSGNTAECTQIITVRDTMPPVLVGCPGPEESASCLADVSLPASVTAIDGCSGPVAVQFSETQSNPGSSCNNVITRTWTATDACGNTASCTQTITVNDTALPSVTSPPDIVVAPGSVPPPAKNATEFRAQGGSLSDRCSSDLLVTSSDSTGGACAGTITRSYTVIDPCGNASTCHQTITVLNLIGNDPIVWHQPLARSGTSQDTDPSAGGTLKYRFRAGSTIPIKIRAYGCDGADATGNANVVGTVEVLGDTNCDDVSDGNIEPIAFNGIGGAGGMMQKIDGYLRYNLDTKQLPKTSRCHILRVTITDTVTGQSRSEMVPLQAK